MPADQFSPRLGKALKADLRVLEQLQAQWREIKADPKLDAFVAQLGKNRILKSGKIVVFTESTETATRLTEKLRESRERVIAYHSGLGAAERRKVVNNFDDTRGIFSTEYRVLVTTEALAEGVNLHAAHAVVNYDIPWNPTRLMQRAGRINRVGGRHDLIHIFNFFPTDKADKEIELTGKAKVKLAAFVSLLGSDFRHLTEDEAVNSHRLFDILNSAEAAEGEDADAEESELAYLREIEKVRDEDPALFRRVCDLPPKARAARPAADPADGGALLTYFKIGELDKFHISGEGGEAAELPFNRAAAKLRAAARTPSAAFPANYFNLMRANRAAFDRETAAPESAAPAGGGARRLASLLNVILTGNKLGQDARDFLSRIAERLAAGVIPAGTVRAAAKALRNPQQWNPENPDTAAQLLRDIVSEEILRPHHAEQFQKGGEKRREVILSEFFAPVPGRRAPKKAAE